VLIQLKWGRGGERKKEEPIEQNEGVTDGKTSQGGIPGWVKIQRQAGVRYKTGNLKQIKGESRAGELVWGDGP